MSLAMRSVSAFKRVPYEIRSLFHADKSSGRSILGFIGSLSHFPPERSFDSVSSGRYQIHRGSRHACLFTDIVGVDVLFVQRTVARQMNISPGRREGQHLIDQAGQPAPRSGPQPQSMRISECFLFFMLSLWQYVVFVDLCGLLRRISLCFFHHSLQSSSTTKSPVDAARELRRYTATRADSTCY